MHVFALTVNGNDFLIEVGLDARVELKVDVGLLARQLDAKHNLTALHDPQFADFWRILSAELLGSFVLIAFTSIRVHLVVFHALLGRLHLLRITQSMDHVFKRRRHVWLDLGERERSRQLEQERLVL